MCRGASILCCPLIFKDISTPQVRINKMLNKHNVDWHPYPSRLASRTLVEFKYSRMLVEFSIKPIYSTIVRENVQIYDIHIPKRYIEYRHFYPWPPRQSKLSPKVLSSPLSPPPPHPLSRQREISHSPQAAFFRKSASSNSRKRWRKVWFAL